MANGKIKTLIADKGFGFIVDAGGTEWFFHHTGVAKGVNFKELKQGDKVQFSESEGPKGPRAEDVELG